MLKQYEIFKSKKKKKKVTSDILNYSSEYSFCLVFIVLSKNKGGIAETVYIAIPCLSRLQTFCSSKENYICINDLF